MRFFVKFTFLCCLIFGRMWARGQNYQPLLRTAQWFVQEDAVGAQNFPWFSHPVDTLINGISYAKVFRDNLPEAMYVREDSAQQKVWIAFPEDGFQDRLLYDFSVQMNDTVKLFFRGNGGDSTEFVVNFIDSVNTAMGFMKRINLQNLDFISNPSSLRWIMAVGNDEHPFYLSTLHNPFPEYHLICNYQSGLKIYDDGFGTCPNNPPPLDIKESETLNLTVFPNPANQLVHFRFEGNLGEGKLQIWDINGRNWFKKIDVSTTYGLSISVSKWPQGMYFYQFRMDSGEMQTGKIQILR